MLNKRKLSESDVTDFGKAISASSRFKPYETVIFSKPIVGENGNKLVSYQWAYEWTMLPSKTDSELKSKRVSDWTQAETSAETGRDIVHKFTVERTDGKQVTVSSDTIPSLLGYVNAKQMKNFPSIVSSVKTLAKLRMQLAILEAQESEYRAMEKEVNSLPKPKLIPADLIDLPKITQHRASIDSDYLNNVTWWKTDGDITVIYRQEDKLPTPNYTTKDQLLQQWMDAKIEKLGGKKPTGLYQLERKVERQEKKVEQAIGSRIKTVDESVSTTKNVKDKIMLNKKEKQLVKEFATKLVGKRKINELVKGLPKIINVGWDKTNPSKTIQISDPKSIPLKGLTGSEQANTIRKSANHVKRTGIPYIIDFGTNNSWQHNKYVLTDPNKKFGFIEIDGNNVIITPFKIGSAVIDKNENLTEASYAPRLKDKFITMVRDVFEDTEDPSEYPAIYKSLCDALKKEFDYFTHSNTDHKF